MILMFSHGILRSFANQRDSFVTERTRTRFVLLLFGQFVDANGVINVFFRDSNYLIRWFITIGGIDAATSRHANSTSKAHHTTHHIQQAESEARRSRTRFGSVSVVGWVVVVWWYAYAGNACAYA